jgi:hypothetical protein
MYVLSKNKEKCVPSLEGFYISRDGSDDPVIYHDSFFPNCMDRVESC